MEFEMKQNIDNNSDNCFIYHGAHNKKYYCTRCEST